MPCLYTGSRSPAVGAVSTVGGVYASAAWDTPSGPSIVVAAVAIFIVTPASTGCGSWRKPHSAGGDDGLV